MPHRSLSWNGASLGRTQSICGITWTVLSTGSRMWRENGAAVRSHNAVTEVLILARITLYCNAMFEKTHVFVGARFLQKRRRSERDARLETSLEQCPKQHRHLAARWTDSPKASSFFGTGQGPGQIINFSYDSGY